MFKILAVLLLMVGLASAYIIEYPFTDDYYFFSDTLHVTTTDTKWAIGSTGKVFELNIVNDSAIDLISIRLQQGTNVSTIGTICNSGGSFCLTSPVLYGVAIDSLWIDASGSGTIYIYGWEVK